MKKKDIIEKTFLGYNDVFAEAVNGILFEGKEVVRSEELEDATPVTSFRDDNNMHHEQIRDVAKLWKKNGVIFSFIGIENQTVPDKDMILRVISYDGATYKSQIGNENIYPVCTIVIYWGKAEWKAPDSLKERLNLPVELENMVSDYKFKLIDMGRMSDEDINKYKGDFKFVAGILSKISSYRPEKGEIKHIDTVLDLLDVVSGDARFKKMKEKIENTTREGREEDMCEYLDEIENKGIEKGIKQGIEQGIERGEELATVRIAKKFKDSNVDIDIIIKATGLSREEIDKL